MTFKLIEEDKEGIVITNIEITKYEFIQALTMHRRLKQKKER